MALRKSLLRIAVFSVCASVMMTMLSACGGSGTSSTPPSGKDITGTATVPNSAGKNLVVSTAYGSGAVSSGGFSAKVPGSSLSLLTILDSDAGKVVMMGMAEPSTSTVAVDPANCAATLVFLGLGGSGLKGMERSSLWTSIKGHTTTAALATAITTAMGSDLYALDGGNASIKSALDAALAAQAGSLPPSASESPSPKDESVTTFQIKSSERNGAKSGEVESRSPEGYGVDNTLGQLEGLTFTYNVGYRDKSDVDHATVPAKFGNGTSFQPASLSATVPLQASTAYTGEYYDVFVFQPIFGESSPSVFSLPDYSGEVAAWKAGLAPMLARGLMKVTAAQMYDALGAPTPDLSSASALDQAVTSFTAINSESANIFVDSREAVNLPGLVARCAGVPANSEADAFSTLAAIAPLIQAEAPDLAQVLASKSLTSAQIQGFRGAMKIMSLMGSWDFSARTGAFAKLFGTGKTGCRSNGFFGRDFFDVQPNDKEFEVNTTFVMNAKLDTTIFNKPGEYTWSLEVGSGAITNAVLNDGNGKVGQEIKTTSSQCYLVTGGNSVGIAIVHVTYTTTDDSGNPVTLKETRRYTPIGDTDFSFLEAQPGTNGPNFTDICSGTWISKPAPRGDGTWGPYRLELWSNVATATSYFTAGSNYTYWDLPAYTGPVQPKTKSWEIVGQTVRGTSSGTTSMSFGVYDYGDKILVVNSRSSYRNDDLAGKDVVTQIVLLYESHVTSRFKLTAK